MTGDRQQLHRLAAYRIAVYKFNMDPHSLDCRRFIDDYVVHAMAQDEKNVAMVHNMKHLEPVDVELHAMIDNDPACQIPDDPKE